MRRSFVHRSYASARTKKRQDSLREAARRGYEARLLTVYPLRDANWPREALTEVLTKPSGLTCDQLLQTVAYLARTRRIDRIVTPDEFDLANATLLPEHMQPPGMGETGTRFFRDKPAMREQARRDGIHVPHGWAERTSRRLARLEPV